MNKTSRAALGAFTSALCCAGAWALEPQGVRLGESLVLTPTVQVAERWEDNFRAVESGREASWITTVSPSLMLSATGRKSTLALAYTLNQDIFHSSHADDNADHHLTAEADVDFDARNRLTLGAGLHQVEETASPYQHLQNDRYTLATAEGRYGLGARTALCQLELMAGAQRQRFQNDLVLPGGAVLNADREYDAASYRGTLFFRLAPRTRSLLEARHTGYAYVSNVTLDSRDTAVLAGVVWEATAMTSGSVKAGVEQKDFDLAAIPTRHNAMWEAGVSWKPRTYSTFTLASQSRLDEGSNGAYAIETRSLNLGWSHQWLTRLGSELSLGYTRQDYLGVPTPAGAERQDRIGNAGLGFTYLMRRWVNVGAGYRYMNNDSNAPARSYERNIFALTVNASL